MAAVRNAEHAYDGPCRTALAERCPGYLVSDPRVPATPVPPPPDVSTFCNSIAGEDQPACTSEANCCKDVRTEIPDWDMLTDATSAPGGPWHVKRGQFGENYYNPTGSVWLEWDDDPDHTTTFRAHRCSDGAPLHDHNREIGPHDQGAKEIVRELGDGQCFFPRGRVAKGAGPFYNHDMTVTR